MTATAPVTSPVCLVGIAQRHALTKDDLLAAWQEWRAAVRAHVIAKRAAGTPFHAGAVSSGDKLDALGLALGTFTRVSRTYEAWMTVAAAYRATTPEPAAAYVAKMGRAYEVVCPEHPRFRRVAWTHQRTPAVSAFEHNQEHHGGARVVIIDRDGRAPSSMLP